MPETLLIRPAEANDAEALSRFASRTFEETFAHSTSAADMAAYLAAHYSPAIQRGEIDDPRATTLIAGDGRDVLGYAQIRDNDVPDAVSDPAAIELVRLYVDRAWHGRGLAIALNAARRNRGARSRRADDVARRVGKEPSRPRVLSQARLRRGRRARVHARR